MSDNVSQAEIYRAAKNVIHNDLGITKEYIDKVIQDTVKTEINKLMKDECFIYGLVEKEVNRALYRKDDKSWHMIHDATNFIKNEINSAILSEVKNRLEIRLKDSENSRKLYDEDLDEIVKYKESGHYAVLRKTDSIKDGKDD